MSKELEALKRVVNEISHYKLQGMGNENWLGIQDVIKDVAILEKALTPPTADEVCKVLSDYLKDKVIYNDRFGFICNEKVIIFLYPSNVLSFNDNYPAHIHNIVGRFYEGVVEMSKLKRYVLLNDNTIIDTLTEIYYLKGENELFRDRPNAVVVTVKIGDVKKTSDNILDLVEVNDLLELDNDWEILKVLRIDKDNQPVCLVRTSSNIEEYAFKDYRKEHIKAIYKRQPNGDYKRYEVY